MTTKNTLILEVANNFIGSILSPKDTTTDDLAEIRAKIEIFNTVLYDAIFNVEDLPDNIQGVRDEIRYSKECCGREYAYLKTIYLSIQFDNRIFWDFINSLDSDNLPDSLKPLQTLINNMRNHIIDLKSQERLILQDYAG